MNSKEEELSLLSIRNALSDHPGRVLLLSYEWISILPKSFWAIISKFVGVSRYKIYRHWDLKSSDFLL